MITSLEVPYTELAAEGTGDTFTRYVLKVTRSGGESTLVSRRFKEFKRLGETLRRVAPQRCGALPSLSKTFGAKLFGWMTSRALTDPVVNERKQKVVEFMLAAVKVARAAGDDEPRLAAVVNDFLTPAVSPRARRTLWQAPPQISSPRLASPHKAAKSPKTAAAAATR